LAGGTGTVQTLVARMVVLGVLVGVAAVPEALLLVDQEHLDKETLGAIRLQAAEQVVVALELLAALILLVLVLAVLG